MEKKMIEILQVGDTAVNMPWGLALLLVFYLWGLALLLVFYLLK